METIRKIILFLSGVMIVAGVFQILFAFDVIETSGSFYLAFFCVYTAAAVAFAALLTYWVVIERKNKNKLSRDNLSKAKEKEEEKSDENKDK